MRPQTRITNPNKIDRILIEQDLKDGNIVIVQFGDDESYSDKILDELNDLCLNYDDNFSIRFYGHYSKSFDCNTLIRLPNVKSLSLDCLCEVYNLQIFTSLKNLKRLCLGIFEIKETEILQSNNLQNLTELIIDETRTKALNLKYLENYTQLKYLIISGHTKNIDVIGNLKNLEYLWLNSISKVSLGFVNKLKKLKSLNFVLGGRENLDEIEANEIETLQINRVRGFNSFNNISNFKNLKNLLIEDQIQLSELNFEKELPNLEDFKLLNCKKFKSLKGLERLSNLKQLRIYKTDINFEEFIKKPLPKSLNILAFYTMKAKLDKEIEDRLLKLGYKEGA